MKKKKVLDQTDWEKVNSMSSEEIDCSDLPEVDESFFKGASFRANMKIKTTPQAR